MARIADRLREVRRRRMVGRDAELGLFREIMLAPALTRSVLYVHGPGGIGKSTLLRAFTDTCAEEGWVCHTLNGRDFEASPDAFTEALGRTLRVSADDAIETITSDDRRQALLIDTFETIQPLEGWLRDVFLPQLSDQTLVVLAGREPLSSEWRGDAIWSPLMQGVALRYLTPDESRDLLRTCGIPDGDVDAALEFTHGYPLALSLLVDAAEHGGSGLPHGEPTPDIVQALLARFVARVPSPRHRAALEVSALLRVTTESVLGAVLNDPDPAELFAWMRELSFVEPGQTGLCPHPIAREALYHELRWRDPDRWSDLHRNARAYYQQRLSEVDDREQQRILWDYIYLHRENPIIRTSFTWGETSGAYPDRAQESDRPLLRQMVERFEGPDSARLFDQWWDDPASTTIVFRAVERGTASTALGFAMRVSLDKANPQDRDQDPATKAAWNRLEALRPLRGGETSTHFRFWMDRDSYHGISPVQSLIMVDAVRHYLMTPGLAHTFFPVRAPEHWAPVFLYAEMPRCPVADFTIDSVPYGVFEHDWRSQPPAAWLDSLAERELTGVVPAAPPAPRETLIVLSEPEFAAATRDALRHLHRAEMLVDNPLLRSRLIVDKAAPGATLPERGTLLQSILRAAIESLRGAARQERGYRALLHTYLTPAATQERAAELLDLPFSTYRRHLAEGINDIVAALWHQEIGASLK